MGCSNQRTTSGFTATEPGRQRSPSIRMLLLAAIGALALLGVAAAPALAARPASKPSEHGNGRGGGGSGGGEGGGTETVPAETGVDISYPQCGTTFPQGQAFGIVGVNGGLANDANACLGPDPRYAQSELYWASAQSIGGVSGEQNASLYVNTADPGNIYNNAPISDWPTGGEDAYGSCSTETVRLRGRTYTVGQDSDACAWEYGYQRARYDINLLGSAASAINGESPPHPVEAAAGAYPWWLDVETANTWQPGAAGQAMNVADLQGMVAAFREAGAATVGVYSTEYQWNQITGATSSASAGSLYQLPVWIPGASSLQAALSNCALRSFTGGSAVSLTQWLTSSFDADHYCLA